MSRVDEPHVASTEFTEVFIERLLTSLQFIPSNHAGGMPAETLPAAVSGSPRRAAPRRTLGRVMPDLDAADQ